MSTPPALATPLLGVRLLTEVGLVTASLVVATSLLAAPVGVLTGLAAGAIVIVLWGAVLSPKRRVDAPLALRVAVELALVATAVAGLASAGHGVGAAVLATAELASLLGLAALGLPPGTDLADLADRIGMQEAS